jgi:hypothetical protein
MRVLRFGLLIALTALPQVAFAKAHLWKFDQVFSNVDGSIQFIRMFVFDETGTAETQLGGKLLQSSTKNYVFPNDLPPENTAHTWILIATPAFAALPGAPTPDYIIPTRFFNPVGDALRYRSQLDILSFPGGLPVDGINAIDRDGATVVNLAINFAGEQGSVDAATPCVDGVDNDADGTIDDPADPGCRNADSLREDPECQDGLNNDMQLGTDFDGGMSVTGTVDPNGPDPQCMGTPWRNKEAASSCGLGYEAGLALAGLAWLRGRQRRR